MKRLTISTENAEFQIIQALKENRTKRHQSGEVFIEGIESVKQAIRAGMVITRIITTDFSRLSGWGRDFANHHPDAIQIQMHRDLYQKICERNEPSELVITAILNRPELENLVCPANPFILVFDRPSDHGNFGSIVRSANSFGIDAIFTVGHGIDPYEPKVIRSSLGAVFHSRIIQIGSIAQLQEWITEQKTKTGLTVIGTDSSAEISLQQEKLATPIVLILGNEAKGMSQSLQALCDKIVSIPLCGSINSLNVACAGSIFLWEIFRNSNPAGI